MGSRLKLQLMLESILGSKNVYFQPPESIKMQYPCIKYELNNIQTLFADNKPAKSAKRYDIMIIDKNPDSLIPGKVGKLPMCSFDRPYTANNLNHWVYKLYY